MNLLFFRNTITFNEDWFYDEETLAITKNVNGFALVDNSVGQENVLFCVVR